MIYVHTGTKQAFLPPFLQGVVHRGHDGLFHLGHGPVGQNSVCTGAVFHNSKYENSFLRGRIVVYCGTLHGHRNPFASFLNGNLEWGRCIRRTVDSPSPRSFEQAQGTEWCSRPLQAAPLRLPFCQCQGRQTCGRRQASFPRGEIARLVLGFFDSIIVQIQPFRLCQPPHFFFYTKEGAFLVCKTTWFPRRSVLASRAIHLKKTTSSVTCATTDQLSFVMEATF